MDTFFFVGNVNYFFSVREESTTDETYPPRRAHSQQGPERLELPLLSSEGRMQRAYSHEGEVPIVQQPLASPHGGKSQELSKEKLYLCLK